MTDLKTRLELSLLVIGISLAIFFLPLLLGFKQPAIEASVKQNMDFMHEMVKKYLEKHKKPPETMEALVQDARTNKYNKTLFNPILKNSGDVIDRQIIEVYSPSVYQSLGPDFQGRQYAGKVGYYHNVNSYAIYGHLSNGKLMTLDGKLLVYSNQ